MPMIPSTDIEIYLIAVRSVAQVVNGSLHLVVRVVVEWRLPAGVYSPPWLTAWSPSSADIAVQLENDNGLSLTRALKPNGTKRAGVTVDLTSGRSKIIDRPSPRSIR